MREALQRVWANPYVRVALVAALLDAWPKPYQASVRAVATTFGRAVGGYVRGQLVIAVPVIDFVEAIYTERYLGSRFYREG